MGERKHTCHARRCTVAVPPTMLMCRKHWFMVPPAIRSRVWRHYRDGQCNLSPPPSEEWHKAADEAIAAVAAKEADRG